MSSLKVDVLVDLKHNSYTLRHYDESGIIYDDITLPIQQDVADVVEVTFQGRYVSTERIPNELYEALVDYLMLHRGYVF